jgi:hypothetical protein
MVGGLLGGIAKGETVEECYYRLDTFELIIEIDPP